MKVGEISLTHGDKVMVERAGETGCGITVTSPGKKPETYALWTGDMETLKGFLAGPDFKVAGEDRRMTRVGFTTRAGCQVTFEYPVVDADDGRIEITVTQKDGVKSESYLAWPSDLLRIRELLQAALDIPRG